MKGEFEASDFVYTGRWWDNGRRRMRMVIYLCRDGQLLGEIFEMPFNKKFKQAVIGGIYRGASFWNYHMRGMDEALSGWQGMLNDHVRVSEWLERDMRAAAQERAYKPRPDNKLEVELLRVRKLYEAYRAAQNTAGMHQLEQAVIAALRSQS